MHHVLLVLGCLGLLAQSTTVQEIPSPKEWVEFSADVRGQDAGGPFEGKFYRGADGSTRKEMGPPKGSIDRIVITNLTRGEQYICRKSCTTRAIQQPTMPPRMRTRPGLTKLDKPFEGYEAYSDDSGTTSTVIPALNFFRVELIAEAIYEKYSNIRVGRQPAALFERPPQ